MLIADRKSKVKEGQIGIVRADKLQITAADDSAEKLASNLHGIMQAIPDIVVAGISTVKRAVIQSSQKKGSSTGGVLQARVGHRCSFVFLHAYHTRTAQSRPEFNIVFHLHCCLVCFVCSIEHLLYM